MKHILKLDDGEEIEIKTLGFDEIPHYLKVAKCFSGAKEDGTTEDVFKNMNDEGLNSLVILIKRTLEESCPDKPEEERSKIGMKYMQMLMPLIMEANSPRNNTHENVKKVEAIKRMTNQK